MGIRSGWYRTAWTKQFFDGSKSVPPVKARCFLSQCAKPPTSFAIRYASPHKCSWAALWKVLMYWHSQVISKLHTRDFICTPLHFLKLRQHLKNGRWKITPILDWPIFSSYVSSGMALQLRLNIPSPQLVASMESNKKTRFKNIILYIIPTSFRKTWNIAKSEKKPKKAALFYYVLPVFYHVRSCLHANILRVCKA